MMVVPPGLGNVGYGVGPERQGAPYGEPLQATERTTRVLNRPKRVCADALPTHSAASAFIHQRARLLAGTINLPWLGKPAMAKATFLPCQKGDISTLP